MQKLRSNKFDSISYLLTVVLDNLFFKILSNNI